MLQNVKLVLNQHHMFFFFFYLAHQAEPEGFSHFHLYVCAAFLVRWRKEILEERDFQVTDTDTEGDGVDIDICLHNMNIYKCHTLVIGVGVDVKLCFYEKTCF